VFSWTRPLSEERGSWPIAPIKNPEPKNKFSVWGFTVTTKTHFLTAGLLTRGSLYRPPLPAPLRRIIRAWPETIIFVRDQGVEKILP
jgi:hypothetical protein